jgi:putative transposase
MPSGRYKSEKIIHKLREAHVLLGQGIQVGDECQRLGISEQTYYRRRKLYGGMRVDQAKRLKTLDAENAGLRQAVADLIVDKQILKEVAEGNF